MNIRLKYIIPFLLVSVFSVVLLFDHKEKSSAQLVENLNRSIPNKVEDYLRRTGVPSVAIAVAKEGKIIWEDGFGWADKEKKLKATPHTIYQIGSITKNFTATAMMILAERDLLDLDKPANNYLAEAKLRGCWFDASDATIKRLLLHTAGLQEYWNSYYQHEIHRKIDTDEAIHRHGILIYKPGSKHLYSSLGYGVAGRIIECVSGRSYDDFMKNEIFEPLGLTETSVRETSEPGENMAQKYDRNGNVCPIWLPNFASSGFIYSSPHDLCRYGMFHLKNHLTDQKTILSDDTIDLMKTAYDLRKPANTNYKLGWGVYNVYGYEIVSHGGGGPGIDAQLVLIPSENIAISVLANSRAGESFEICKMIGKELVPNFSVRNIWKSIVSSFKQREQIKNIHPNSYIGEWVGDITTFKGNIKIRLIIDSDRTARIQKVINTFKHEPWIHATHGVKIYNGFLDMWFNESIIEIASDRSEDYMRLMVQEQEGKLFGSASAGCDNLAPNRSIFYLPSCVELKKIE